MISSEVTYYPQISISQSLAGKQAFSNEVTEDVFAWMNRNGYNKFLNLL